MPIISGQSGGGSTSPGYEIGYDQITSSVNIASTTESAGTTIITCAAHTFDGALVMVEFFSPFVTDSSVSSLTIVSLFESSTQISRLANTSASNAAQQSSVALTGRYRFTPSAGSHTYTVTAFANSTTGTPAVGAGAGGTGAYPPCFVRFTKV